MFFKWQKRNNSLSKNGVDQQHTDKETKQLTLSRQIKDGITPDGFQFFALELKTGKTTIIGISVFVLTLAAIAFVPMPTEDISAQDLHKGTWNITLLFAFCLLLMLRQKWLEIRAKPKPPKTRILWGLLIGENELIYRDSESEVFVERGQIEAFETHRRKSRQYLRIRYRLAAHFQAKLIHIGDKYGYDKTELIKTLLTWKEKGESHATASVDNSDDETWLLKLRDIYQYKHWLPQDLIDAIPEIPCDMETRKTFIEKAKPFVYRMRLADSINGVFLALVGMINAMLCLATIVGSLYGQFALMAFGPFYYKQIAFIIWMLITTTAYVTCLSRWIGQKRPAVLANLCFLLWFLSLFHISGAWEMLRIH